MKELISIVTTLYNYADYITDLIDSVIAQTYTNWELIIIDDASTDNPHKRIKRYLTDQRIKYIKLPENKGYSIAKNKGIEESSGEYIVMIDADDMLTEDSLELRYNVLSKSDKLWIHGEVLVFNNQSKTQLSNCSRIWKRNFRQKLISEGNDLTTTYHHRLIHAQSVMVKRELHKIVGLYDESLRFSSDNEMWRRIVGFGFIPAHIEDFVAKYRVHGRRMSRSDYKKARIHKVKGYIKRIVPIRVTKPLEETGIRILKD